MNSTAKRKDLIYDVGMHKGEDADYYLKKGFKVIGFEADPGLLAYCRNRFQQEIKDERLRIVEGAIIERPREGIAKKTVKFYKNKDNSVWGTVNAGWACRNEALETRNEVIEVSAVDFEECLIKYGIPYYLKIDIEGSDSACLTALLDFDQKPDYVSIESEKMAFDRLLEELALLERLGYTKFKAVQQMDIVSQKEPYPSREGVYVGHKFEHGSSGLFGGDLPGRWKDHAQIIREYQGIFRLYRLFGDYGQLNRFLIGRLFLKVVNKILRKPIPGWYDTHARHSLALKGKD